MIGARAAGLGLVATVVACASTRPQQARNDVADVLDQRAGAADVVVDQYDAEARARVEERVDALLAEPITVEAATKVALLNNPDMLATLEQLGIAQAELVAAGLLENPSIGGDLVNSTKGFGLGGGLSLSQSLLSAFLIPAKKRVAKANLQRAVLTVSAAALALVRDVKISYAGVQAAVAEREIHLTLVQTAEVADELSARMFEAGNATELERELFAADLDEARLELADADLALTQAREVLNRDLGLWGRRVGWRLATPLPPPPKVESELGDLEALGVDQRLDLSAARSSVDALDFALKLRRRGFVPMIEAGVEARNEVGDDEGHEWVVGPSLSIEIPIFNPGHADIAQLGAQLRQAQYHVQHLAIETRSHIREQRKALQTARRQAEYIAASVLPRRETIGARALERYNGMLIGAFDLLEIREEQVEAQRSWIAARHRYWVARAELEFTVGGKLPAPPATAPGAR